jgi:hypothetical protein
MNIILGIFLILHGLVHLLYTGQSLRWFELEAGLLWPDGSWLFAGLLGEGGTRWLAGITLPLAAVGFIAGGAGLLLRQAWGRPVTLAAVALSTLIYVLLWDGRFQALAAKGGVGLLINALILIVVLVMKWPAR